MKTSLARGAESQLIWGFKVALDYPPAQWGRWYSFVRWIIGQIIYSFNWFEANC